MCTHSHLPDLSPIREEPWVDFAFLPRIANIPPWLKKKTEKAWKADALLSVKFADDGVNAEVVNLREVPLMTIDNQSYKESQAEKTTGLLEHIRVKGK